MPVIWPSSLTPLCSRTRTHWPTPSFKTRARTTSGAECRDCAGAAVGARMAKIAMRAIQRDGFWLRKFAGFMPTDVSGILCGRVGEEDTFASVTMPWVGADGGICGRHASAGVDAHATAGLETGATQGRWPTLRRAGDGRYAGIVAGARNGQARRRKVPIRAREVARWRLR